jgi:predicted nucleic acid-binding protein
MPDEDSPLAESALERVSTSGGIVPPLFRIEVGNALLIALRRKRVTADFLGKAFERFGLLPLEQDSEGADHVWTRSIDIAVTHGLSLYDATYLELALRRGLPLATLDRRLADAARNVGVAVPAGTGGTF